VVISILTRRLREGKTLEDFRAVWHREGGFGVPTRVVTGQRLDDPREILEMRQGQVFDCSRPAARRRGRPPRRAAGR
jgi:hypothetical protein